MSDKLKRLVPFVKLTLYVDEDCSVDSFTSALGTALMIASMVAPEAESVESETKMGIDTISVFPAPVPPFPL